MSSKYLEERRFTSYTWHEFHEPGAENTTKCTNLYDNPWNSPDSLEEVYERGSGGI